MPPPAASARPERSASPGHPERSAGEAGAEWKDARGRRALSVAAVRTYLAERFPVPVTLALSIAVGLAAYAAGQGDALRAGAALRFDGAAAGGCAMAFLFLFLLRVYDEHKDFAHDARTRPDRPVQRGVITLAQLRGLGAVAVAGQLALAAVAGPRAAVVYLVPLLYSVLMAFEFFAPAWLSARIALYALSHTFVMSLLALALGVRFAPDGGIAVELVGAAVWMMPAFFAVDVLRKTWAPDGEIDGVDSYSRRLGVAGAGALGGGLLCASAVAAGWVGVRLGGGPSGIGIAWIGACAAVTAWSLYEIAAFARRPVAARQKRMELVAGVHVLAMLVGVVVVAGLAHGARWGMP